jgi:hypothetical protein
MTHFAVRGCSPIREPKPARCGIVSPSKSINMSTYVIYTAHFEPKSPAGGFENNPNLGSFECMNALRFVELNPTVDLLDPEIVGKVVSTGRVPMHSMYERFVEVLHIFHCDEDPTRLIREFYEGCQSTNKGEFETSFLYEYWPQVPIFPELYVDFVPN